MQCIAFTLSTGAQLGRCAPKRGKTRQKRPLFGYRLITRFYRPRLACCHARQGARSAAAGQRGTLPPRCRHHEHEVGGRARGQPADHEDGVERHRETPISAAIESRVSLACSGKFTGTESAGLRTCLSFAIPASRSSALRQSQRLGRRGFPWWPPVNLPKGCAGCGPAPSSPSPVPPRSPGDVRAGAPPCPPESTSARLR